MSEDKVDLLIAPCGELACETFCEFGRAFADNGSAIKNLMIKKRSHGIYNSAHYKGMPESRYLRYKCALVFRDKLVKAYAMVFTGFEVCTAGNFRL